MTDRMYPRRLCCHDTATATTGPRHRHVLKRSDKTNADGGFHRNEDAAAMDDDDELIVTAPRAHCDSATIKSRAHA